MNNVTSTISPSVAIWQQPTTKAVVMNGEKGMASYPKGDSLVLLEGVTGFNTIKMMAVL